MLIVAQIDEIVVRLPLTYSLHIPLDLFGEARQSQYNSLLLRLHRHGIDHVDPENNQG